MNRLLLIVLVLTMTFGMIAAQYYVGACAPCTPGRAVDVCCKRRGYLGGFCQDGRFPLCFR
ncbi:hypothetical protein I4U23_005570 [Adineta vaga]|nr:hypothetical protein I4U23_005570 [Adineta vaga]